MKYLNYLVFLHFFVAVLASEYSKDEHVFELNYKNFDKVVHSSNYTTVVKFYAPWCGYCKQLAPIYHKLGKYFHKDSQLAVNVAAVDCDKQANKQLCSQYRVQSFPTIMVFRPPKHSRTNPTKSSMKHASEVYSGERSLKAISAFVTSRVKNYVTKFHSLPSKSMEKWLNSNENLSSILLITKSHNVSPLLKTLAIDFLNSAQFGVVTTSSLPESISINNTEIELSGSLPTLVFYDKSTGKFVSYDKSEKLNDKTKISQWIMEVTGAKPHEGPLSKRELKYAKYRSGKKNKAEKDEL